MKVGKITTQEEELDIIGATLLSVEEVEGLPKRLRGYGDWWWLRSHGFVRGFAALVNGDGSADDCGYFVDTDMPVRPALIINNLNSSNLKIGDSFMFGGEEFAIVSGTLAFCKADIGTHCFRANWKAKNGSDYEKSDVKKFVDSWFEQNKN